MEVATHTGVAKIHQIVISWLSLAKQVHPLIDFDHKVVSPSANSGIAARESSRNLVRVKVLRKMPAKCLCFLTSQVAVANESRKVLYARFNEFDKIYFVGKQTWFWFGFLFHFWFGFLFQLRTMFLFRLVGIPKG